MSDAGKGRPWLSKSKLWLMAAAVFAAAAIFDWTRPPQEQKSAYVFERLVIGPYRVLIRPVTSYAVHCRFRPTCSQYSVEAVRKRGFVVGLWLTVNRLRRCMPWVRFGTDDPVPAAHGP